MSMKQRDTEWTVGELARLSGVSVRTLHHYDEIGLLQPVTRSHGGYRLYDEAGLTRLRRILFYRELGFGLDDIAAMLDEPDPSAQEQLRRQHRLVRDQLRRHEALLAALEKEMAMRDMGMSLTPEEQFEVFGTDEVSGAWAEEAAERWGESEPYRQSRGRTAAYTKDDWIAIKAEAAAGLDAFAAAMRDGVPADGARGMALAQAHRDHITRWFYDCTPEIHRGLAELYVADPRFTATYEAVAPGLAQYVHDAIVANAART